MADDAPDERAFNNIVGKRFERLQAGLNRVAADNARRVDCSLCSMPILPEDMTRHYRIHHSDEE